MSLNSRLFRAKISFNNARLILSPKIAAPQSSLCASLFDFFNVSRRSLISYENVFGIKKALSEIWQSKQ